MKNLTPVIWLITLTLPLAVGESGFAEPPAADSAAAAPAAKREMVGRWKLKSLRRGGRETVPPAGANVPLLVIGEDVIVRQLPGRADAKIRYRVDTSKSPRQLDWIEPGQKASPRIFEVKGDTFRMAIRRDGTRPADFAPGENVIVLTFARVAGDLVADDAPGAGARTRQVELQAAAGAIVFTRPDVRRELDLNPEQVERVTGIIRETAPKYNQLVARIRQQTDAAARGKLLKQAAAVRSRAKQQVVKEILTDAQRKAWETMLGEPATAAELDKVQARRRNRPAGRARSTRSAPPEIPAVEGKPTGEVYQELLNAVIVASHGMPDVMVDGKLRAGAEVERKINPCLHLLVADPALTVYEPVQPPRQHAADTRP